MIRWLYFRLVLPVLRWLPFPSTLLGPVKGHHQSFPDWAESQDGALGNPPPETLKPQVIGQQPSRLETIAPPKLALPRMPPELARESSFSCPQTYVGVLPQGRIATEYQEAISHQDKVFGDLLYPRPNGDVAAHSLILPRLPQLKKVEGRLAAIGTGRASNYYHWVNDCLPRLWLLEREGLKDFGVLVPANGSGFHRRSLELLGIPQTRWAFFGNEHWRVKELLLPSLTNSVGHGHPEACRWLRDRLLAAPPVVEAGKRSRLPKRLWISRAKAGKRRLTNEAEVLDLLQQRGFTSLVSEHLSLEQQIAHFAAAEVVVASHGAGLTNCLFMKPGTMVLELLPWLKVKSCYFSLAHAAQLHYSCISDAPEEDKPRPSGRQPDRDFSIPIDRLETALNHLGVGAS